MWCQKLVWSQSLFNLSVIPRTLLLWTWYFLFLYLLFLFYITFPRFWQIIVIPIDWKRHLMVVLHCESCCSLWYCNGTSTLLSCSTIRNCKRLTLRYFVYSYHAGGSYLIVYWTLEEYGWVQYRYFQPFVVENYKMQRSCLKNVENRNSLVSSLLVAVLWVLGWRFPHSLVCLFLLLLMVSLFWNFFSLSFGKLLVPCSQIISMFSKRIFFSLKQIARSRSLKQIAFFFCFDFTSGFRFMILSLGFFLFCSTWLCSEHEVNESFVFDITLFPLLCRDTPTCTTHSGTPPTHAGAVSFGFQIPTRLRSEDTAVAHLLFHRIF